VAHAKELGQLLTSLRCRPRHETRHEILKLVSKAEGTEVLAQYLSELQHPQNLAHKDCLVRSTCAKAIGVIADPAAVPCLMRLLDDFHSTVREAASEALAKINPEAVIPLLIQRSRASRWQVRRDAAACLGRVHHPESHGRLLELMRGDRCRRVRQVAAQGLARHGDDCCLEEPTGPISRRVQTLVRELVKRKQTADLVKVRHHPRVGVRLAFVRSFIWVGQVLRVGRPHLRIMLSDRDWRVRLQAAMLLDQYEPSLLRAHEQELMKKGAAGELAALWRNCPSLSRRYRRFPTPWEIRIYHVEHTQGLAGLRKLLPEARTPLEQGRLLVRCAIHYALENRNKTVALRLLHRAQRRLVDEFHDLVWIDFYRRLIEDAVDDPLFDWRMSQDLEDDWPS
jgi:hypothetical protein